MTRMIRALQIAIKSIASLAILAIATGMSGCMFWPVNKKDVIGTYRSVLQDGTPSLPDGGSEMLELKADGTCIQKIALKDGRTFFAQGTWRYSEPPSLKGYIILEGTRIVVNDESISANIGKVIAGPRMLPVTRNLIGRMTIGSSETSHYEKK